MKKRTVILPKRDSNGYLIGTQEVEVEWKCPHCGVEMGEPYLHNFFEDGSSYVVHKWKNKCLHIAKYNEVTIVPSEKTPLS
ncbi:hypothetical protein CN918_29500 [Priestia megaterium]|nr:hypothetical protein CN918_29500 [Priestia megaterium]